MGKHQFKLKIFIKPNMGWDFMNFLCHLRYKHTKEIQCCDCKFTTEDESVGVTSSKYPPPLMRTRTKRNDISR